VPIVLFPQHELTGVVGDENGRPVAGAEVIIASVGQDQGVCWAHGAFPRWRAATAADGRFLVPALPRGVPCSVWIRHPDFTRAEGTYVPGPEPIAARLHRGARLKGEVTLPDGKPAVGAWVGCGMHHGLGGGSARTDDQGRYTLVSLAPDSYDVWAATEELTAAAVAARPVEAGETATVEAIRLIPGCAVRGQLFDVANGGPARDTHARFLLTGPTRPFHDRLDWISSFGQRVRVAADGSFRLRLPPGRSHLATAAGIDGWEVVELAELVVGDENETEWRIGLRRIRDLR
jgi:hypothetical protein